MNNRPPWSRMRWHQPESRASLPMSLARSAPQVSVRYRCMGGPFAAANRSQLGFLAARAEGAWRPRFVKKPPLDSGAAICTVVAGGHPERPRMPKSPKPETPKPMTTAEAAVASLVGHGIDTMYGLPGVQNDHLFDALFKAS